MLAQLSKSLMAAAVSSALALAFGPAQGQQPAMPAQTESGQAAQPQAGQPAPGQAKKKEWKDRAEYDLVVGSIGKETDPNKRLALLDQWTQKYPTSDYRIERMVTYLETYRQLGNAQKMWETAKQILAEDPKNFQANYWTALLVVSMGNTSPENLEFGEKTARMLAGNVDTLKPAETSEADWTKVKNESKLESVGHRALGWIAMQRKTYEEAEKHFTEALRLNPADAQGAYWLGQSILGEKKPERQGTALFYFARAAAYDGPGALDPAARKKMEDYVRKAYNTYHGSDEGLQQLLATAKMHATPPADFKVLSEEEVKAARQEQLAKSSPQLALWVKLKDALKADPSYFDTGMKGALIPPEDQGPFHAKVISATPARAPKEIVATITGGNDPGSNEPEVTLKLVEGAMPGPADPGTVIDFRGIASQFQSNPFMVTFEVEKKNISGWPTPAPVKKGGAKKGGKKK